MNENYLKRWFQGLERRAAGCDLLIANSFLEIILLPYLKGLLLHSELGDRIHIALDYPPQTQPNPPHPTPSLQHLHLHFEELLPRCSFGPLCLFLDDHQASCHSSSRWNVRTPPRRFHTLERHEKIWRGEPRKWRGFVCGVCSSTQMEPWL